MLLHSDLLPLGLLRFAQREHLKSMLDTGELRFNLIDYYWEHYEGQAGRFDKYEATDVIAQHRDIAKFTINDRDFQVAKDGPPIPFRLTDRMHYTHACCFSIFYNRWTLIDGVHRIFDPRMFDFGGSVAIITNIKAFLASVFDAVKKDPQVHYAQAAIVEYVDLAYHSGDYGPFRKPKEYEYQEEYRIALVANTDAPLMLHIGAMRDFASGPLDKLECKNVVEEDIGIFS